MRRAVIAVIVAGLGAFGCGGSQPATDQSKPSSAASSGASGNTGQTSQQAAQSMAQALQQMAQGAQGVQTGADGKPIQLVDFEKLMALLPDVSGWEKEKPHGEEQSQFMKVSEGDVRYTKGDFHVKVTITDAAMNPGLMGLFSLGAALSNERSSTGFKRSATYGGQPAIEEWNSENKNAKVTIVANKRFIVDVEGNGMDSFDVVKEVANAIDVSKVAALK